MSARLWTPAFVGMLVANFATTMVFYLLVPTMASYAMAAFGVGPAEGGTLASIFFIGALAARFVSGGVLERLGARLMATTSALAYVATTAAYLVAPTFLATLVLRLANGVAFGLLSSALVSSVMLAAPHTRRAEAAGWFGVGVSLAVGLGPFLAITLHGGPGGMRAVFVAATAFAALALALSLLVGRRFPDNPHHAEQPHGPVWRRLLDTRALGVGLVVLLGAFSYSAILAFLSPATAGTDLAPAASVFFLVYAAVVLVTRPLAGRVQDRHGEVAVLLPATLLMTVAMALVAVLGPGWLLLAGAVVLGFGWGTLTTGGQAAGVTRVPLHRTGAAVATYFFMLDLGTGVGPIVLGLLVPPFGYRGAFGAAVGVAALAVVAYAVEMVRVRPGRPRARP